MEVLVQQAARTIVFDGFEEDVDGFSVRRQRAFRSSPQRMWKSWDNRPLKPWFSKGFKRISLDFDGFPWNRMDFDGGHAPAGRPAPGSLASPASAPS